ncbi:MAG: hypothetical protein JXP72_08570 [Coriobacteriia bacterium]|nr:hypothetical protein [Coriobacteriia bacterium]
MKVSTRVRVAAFLVLVMILVMTFAPLAFAKGSGGGTGATGDGMPPWVENGKPDIPGAAWSKPGTWEPTG